MNDVRCRLLTENLPGLTVLYLSNKTIDLDDNNLSSPAIRLISQLQLKELYIGTRLRSFRL